jgi:hypothetical protein
MTTDKLCSTTLSIDPNTFDENVTYKQLPMERKDFECDCEASSIPEMKCCDSMHKWLSFAFLGKYESSFNPRKCDEYNKLVEFFYNCKNVSDDNENYIQMVKD